MIIQFFQINFEIFKNFFVILLKKKLVNLNFLIKESEEECKMIEENN